MKEGKSTRERILAAATQEFLAKGFSSASLRNIVKTAGVTTGAFYGYYDSKEALFAALVEPVYDHLIGRYREALATFESLPIETQPEKMGQISYGCMQELLQYSYAHRDALHLILRCAKGTGYAGMIDELVELEVEATHKYYIVLGKLGHPVPKIDLRLEHILVTGMLNAYFEMILHDMPPEYAKQYLQELNDFYTVGWMKIMGQ